MNQFDPRYMQLLVSKLDNIISRRQNVISVASELNVSRQTIHKHLCRYKKFGEDGIRRIQTRKRSGPAHNRTSEELENLVIKLSKQYSADGVETLADRLQYEHNISLNPSTIYRILKRNDIRYTEHYKATKKRWKKRLFSHQIPGQELQMDNKYPFGYKQGKVIYTAIDDATRWAFVWSYKTANGVNSADFLRRLVNRAPFRIKKLRTDQGTEFLNEKFTNVLNEYEIEHRKNTPYCPEENGKIERFHETLNQKALCYGFYQDNR